VYRYVLAYLLTVQTAIALPCLSWTAPLTRVDGSLMQAEDTSGYRLYMERITKNGFDTDVRDIGNVNRYCYKYTLKGTYWFQVERVDVYGLRSQKSEKQKTEMK